jgi:protein BCP1
LYRSRTKFADLYVKNHPAIKTLISYLSRNASGALAPLSTLFNSGDSAQVGLILTERFLNMPVEILPPMYRMLLEEIQWAIDDKEPYSFTHYLIWSKTYHEVASQLEDPEVSERPKKKSKASKASGGSGDLFYFHPEDELLQQHAVAYGGFEYETKADAGASDARRVFSEAGIKPMGHLILIEAAKFKDAVDALSKQLAPS